MPELSTVPRVSVRRGRPALQVLSLSGAAEMIARLACLDEAAVLERLRAAPFSFFPHAKVSGDGLHWRIPEQDVWRLVGREELMTPAEVAEGLRFSAKTIQRKLQSGELQHVIVFGERRVSRLEFLRLQRDPSVEKPRRRFAAQTMGGLA